MFDENAFGILIEYFELEDDEYANAETESFVERFSAFERLVLERLRADLPARTAHVIALGHALFVEFEQELGSRGLIGWVKRTGEELRRDDFAPLLVLTHGGRWLKEDTRGVESRTEGALTVTRVSLPSEPLRRALLASAACHGLSEDSAWGPGVYIDTEALTALELAPKNQPTPLSVAGADFYRIGG